MVTERKFTRFNSGRSTSTGKTDESPISLKEIPPGGMCLSAFLVVSDRENKSNVLMGRIDPSAPWDHVGALDPTRVEVHSKGWMLPSSHLIVHESPQDAARRIAVEQLDLGKIEISEPKIVSEVYPPKNFPELGEHWDLEFIFSRVIPNMGKRSVAFRELRFIIPEETKRSEISRSHDDVLTSLGYKFSG